MHGFPKNEPRELVSIDDTIEDEDDVRHPPGPGRGHFYEPTKEERYGVWLAAALGAPHEEICKHLNNGEGITAKTLRKHFRNELNHGMWEANMVAVGNLFDTMKNCKDLKVKQRATEFWLERRMGFTIDNQRENEPNKLVITVEGGLPKLP